MRRWRCHVYRALLVDAVEGRLDGRRRRRLDAHLASCPACAADLASLHDIPALLRTSAVPDPGDEFFSQQRQAIHQAIRRAAPARVWWPRPLSSETVAAWRLPLAAAASVALALLVFRLAMPWTPPRARPPATAVATLDPGVLTELQDVLHVIAPHDEVLPLAPHADDPLLTSAPLDNLLGFHTEPLLWEAHDLDDEVLDSIGDLLGNVT